MTKYFIIILPLLLVACKTTPADKLAFSELNKSWSTIGPRYINYVQQDASKDPELRSDLIKEAEAVTKLLKMKVGG